MAGSMISYDDALALVRQHAGARSVSRVPLMDALGKRALHDVKSSIAVPSFKNSAMDGFAVCADVLAAASEAHSITLPVAAVIPAGEIGKAAHTQSAAHIMTGAPVPEPFDAVVPVERVRFDEQTVTFTSPALLGDHIRHVGEDVQAGCCVLKAGDLITPEVIMVLSALGITQVDIAAPKRLHIISTGNEISDEYAAPLEGAQIYNSNAPYLLAAARQHGVEARYEGIVRDDPALFEAKLSALKEPALIISTGAVSKGVWDFIPDSLRALGADIHFHRVNIRPGKPVLFATLPNGSVYFGLPGNPVSAVIGFTFFVMPLMRALQGRPEPQPIMAKLANSFIKKGDFHQFLKSTLSIDLNGQAWVSLTDGQESFKIRSMAASNAWVLLDGSQTVWDAGVCVPVYVSTVDFQSIAQESAPIMSQQEGTGHVHAA